MPLDTNEDNNEDNNRDFDEAFEEKALSAIAELLAYGFSKSEILRKLEVPQQNILENTKRILAWTSSFSHWLKVGYSYPTARALASVKWGQDSDVKLWAISIMLKETNLRLEDMI